MQKNKTQVRRIVDAYVAVVVMITAVTLVITGIAISKINTDYMQTGVRAGKIVVERENTQISVITHEGIRLTPKKNYLEIADKVLTFLPPPVNTTYLIAKEIVELANEKSVIGQE